MPLLFIPGLLCDARLFAAQTAALDGARVVDQSAAPDIRAAAAAILREAPERFALAGLSMGGYLCFEILRQAPQRVERLALIATTARPDAPEKRADREQQIRLTEQGGFARVASALIPKFLAPGSLAAHGPLVGAMAEATGPERFIRQLRVIMSRPDSRPDLARIACPTLVLVGTEDALTPPDLAREMARGIPGARLAMIEGAGHLPPIERPGAMTAALKEWF